MADTPDDLPWRDIAEMAIEQRNRAHDAEINAGVRVRMLEREIERLKAELDQYKAAG